MKALGIAFLPLFGSSYTCEQLFSAMNYIISDIRNRLTDDLSAACVALKHTKYEPRLDKLSASMQQQKSHSLFKCMPNWNSYLSIKICFCHWKLCYCAFLLRQKMLMH